MSQELSDRPPRGQRARAARMLIGSGTVTSVLTGLFLIVLWRDVGAFALGPLANWPRQALIAFLSALLAAYPTLVLAAVLGLIVSAAVFARGRRAGAARSNPGRAATLAARGTLTCASVLLALAVAEGCAAAWLKWEHRLPSTTHWAVKGPDDGREVSIVVIGGSSALGVPYDKRLSIGAIVGRELARAIPDRRFHLRVLARRGATLEDQQQALARLAQRPDLLIVYSGHNEYITRFSWLHRAAHYVDDSFARRRADGLHRLASISPLFRLVAENLEKQRVGTVPKRLFGPRETLIGRPAFTDEENAAVVADFQRRLGAIVAGCERAGCLVALIVPPSREAWDPNQSYALPSTTLNHREGLFRRMKAAQQLETVDPNGAIAAYRAIVASQPTFAEAHYRLARLLEAAGNIDEARAHAIIARDRDGLPMRCTTPLENACRAVARRWPRVLLIDGPAVSRARAPSSRLLGERSFHDNVHPTLAGHVALAEAVLERLAQRRAFDWPEAISPPRLTPERIAERFGLDSAAWIDVCEQTITQLNQIVDVPYDPSERILLRDRYRRALKRLQAGAPPETADVPGTGETGEAP